jgi:hypothetical protein
MKLIDVEKLTGMCEVTRGVNSWSLVLSVTASKYSMARVYIQAA